jgi:hypothetical protein
MIEDLGGINVGTMSIRFWIYQCGHHEYQKGSLRIEETVNLTTKLKSLLFVIMHSHKKGSPHQKDVVLIRKTMIKYGSYSMMAETSMRYPSRKRTQ